MLPDTESSSTAASFLVAGRARVAWPERRNANIAMNARIILISVLSLFGAAVPVGSADLWEPDELVAPAFVPRSAASHADSGIDAAVRRVRRETGGRLLSADTVEQSDGQVYRIKVLLPSGRMRVFVIDADDR